MTGDDVVDEFEARDAAFDQQIDMKTPAYFAESPPAGSEKVSPSMSPSSIRFNSPTPSRFTSPMPSRAPSFESPKQEKTKSESKPKRTLVRMLSTPSPRNSSKYGDDEDDDNVVPNIVAEKVPKNFRCYWDEAMYLPAYIDRSGRPRYASCIAVKVGMICGVWPKQAVPGALWTWDSEISELEFRMHAPEGIIDANGVVNIKVAEAAATGTASTPQKKQSQTSMKRPASATAAQASPPSSKKQKKVDTNSGSHSFLARQDVEELIAQIVQYEQDASKSGHLGRTLNHINSRVYRKCRVFIDNGNFDKAMLTVINEKVMQHLRQLVVVA